MGSHYVTETGLELLILWHAAIIGMPHYTQCLCKYFARHFT
jgi:hypothetical protein